MIRKLAIGAAQFGLNYGIANKSGMVPRGDISEIIALARACGIDTIDTAIAYGSSENVLGEVGVEDFKVVTKLPPLENSYKDITTSVRDEITASRQRLKVRSLYAVLLHRASDLFAKDGSQLLRALEDLRADGVVEKIGVSFYQIDDLRRVTDSVSLDIVQVPLNVVDRRFQSSGWLGRLKERGVEVHTRSAFLQGLLLMELHRIPEKFSPWRSLWENWHLTLDKANTTPLAACLSYPFSCPEIDRVVIGLDNVKQFREILSTIIAIKKLPDTSFMTSTDADLINPSSWEQL